jgi:hypothetical protein
VVLVVEHGSTRGGRWLRRNRFRLALWIAVAEAALVLFDLVDLWPAFFLAVGVIAFHLLLGRRISREEPRLVSSTAAVSQVLVAILPFALAALALAAVLVISILAVAAVAAVAFFLFSRR